MRVKQHPVLKDMKERKEVTVYFNNVPYQAYEGEPIAAALMAGGTKKLRSHETSGAGRGIYCNIGHCFECRVKVEESSVVRACITPVRDGMKINSLPE